MRTALLIALPLLLSVAAPIGAAAPATIDVHLTNFRFTPSAIRLVHGQSYVLRIANDAGGGHNFMAKEFFAAATLDGHSKSVVRGGTIEVPRHSAVEIHLVAPPAGQYKLKCGHFLHAGFGMKGQIIVS